MKICQNIIKKPLTIIFILFIIILSIKECNSTAYMEYEPTWELQEKVPVVLDTTIKKGDTYETFIKRLQLYQQALLEFKTLYTLNCEEFYISKMNKIPPTDCFLTPQIDYLLNLGKDNDVLVKYLKMYIDVSSNSSTPDTNKIEICLKMINHLCNNKKIW